MTKFSERLQRVAKKTDTFKQFGRGVERETLRYSAQGSIALTPHPDSLGKALTNDLVTTDFAESLMEFITPVSQDVHTLLNQLEDIHHFAQKNIGDEKLWPLSMPCFVNEESDIKIAQFGESNSGKMKTLYRAGLKNRYGSLMQIISGVHFNFSFPDGFWDALFGEQSEQARQESQSNAYFSVIRNYYRFGWLIPYFFGASPALCSSFIQGRKTDLPFENIGKTLYLPYATSLRLSDLGYTSNEQSSLKISFNSLDEYLEGLNRAIRTPSQRFADMGVKENGEYRQLNSNILQIENELYAPIRPKRVAKRGEKPSEALRRGVEYIEVRSLDVNPFSPIGITEQQVRFLDMFVTWTALTDSEEMNECELECWRDNWRKVVVEGRKPGLELQIGCHGEKLTLQAWAKRVFTELREIAIVMDEAHGGRDYQDVCDELERWIDDPELTLSAQVLQQTKQAGGMGKMGAQLGEAYRDKNLTHHYQYYSEEDMQQEVTDSRIQAQAMEASDDVSFDEFLSQYFSYLQ